MELRMDHMPRLLETTDSVHCAVSLIASESFIASGADRLEDERQALATLDHPHIAKVLDAGTTDTGRPFFFTEPAKGLPLTQFCEVRRLSIAGRLTLFRQICSAIAHAHEKGIVHRNLKPNSILVEAPHGRPVVNVVDFGLVKAVNAVAFTEQTVRSALETTAGTPLYMAPEQAGPNARDADARADIYALGAILFELLTGTTPIEAAILNSTNFGEILQAIQGNRLPAPSEHLQGTRALRHLPATRQIDSEDFGPLVRRELDRIVMKALAKEPDQRYQSAQALACDLEQIPAHGADALRSTTSEGGQWKSARRRQRHLIATGLLLASAAIGAMSIRWPAGAEAVRHGAIDPQQPGAARNAGPPRSGVVGAFRYVARQSLPDGNGLQLPEGGVFTRADGGEPSTSTNRVWIDNFAFHPGTLQVPAGTKVVWLNADDMPHSVRSTEDLFRSGLLDTEDMYEHEFSEPGTYEYYCGPHPHMTGKIVVR